jgi:integration host factor subunit beta
MTQSDLISRLAPRYPQLVAKDAEVAVKVILDALTSKLAHGQRIEIRGSGCLQPELPAASYGPKPRDGREGPGAGQARPPLQSGHGAARAGQQEASGVGASKVRSKKKAWNILGENTPSRKAGPEED